jgi:hypothetical protein
LNRWKPSGRKKRPTQRKTKAIDFINELGDPTEELPGESISEFLVSVEFAKSARGIPKKMETFWRTPADYSNGPFGGIWTDASSDWKASLQVNMPDPGGLFGVRHFTFRAIYKNIVLLLNPVQVQKWSFAFEEPPGFELDLV